MNIENTLYHGSKNNFNEFEIPKFHDNGGTLGYGIYLTDSIERAKSYANDSGYLYTVELNDVHHEISNRTQKQLKAFSEQNPAIKQPEHNAAKTLKR